MRGDLVSRPVGDVLDEAERLVKAGVRELLVISQDTSAYGVDTKYRTGFGRAARLKPACWSCAMRSPSWACGPACIMYTLSPCG